MKTMDWYKEKYKSAEGPQELILKPNGKVDVPVWLMTMLIHKVGLKSKKKRIVKKVIKKQLSKLITLHLETNQ